MLIKEMMDNKMRKENGDSMSTYQIRLDKLSFLAD